MENDVFELFQFLRRIPQKSLKSYILKLETLLKVYETEF